MLRRDNRAIIRAASQASKAADWLLARTAPPAEAQAVEPQAVTLQAEERMAA